MLYRCRLLRYILLSFGALNLVFVNVASANNTGPTGYRAPPEEMAAILEARPLPEVTVSPNSRWLILTEREGAPTIRDLAAPAIQVGVRAIDPKTRARHADRTATGVGMTLVETSTGQKIALAVPREKLSIPLWSADSRSFLFRHAGDDGVELWAGDVESKRARRVARVRLMALRDTGVPCLWMPDSRHAVCHTVPTAQSAPPDTARSWYGPGIQETEQKESFGPAGPEQMRDERDASIFEYYQTSQPVLVDVATGKTVAVGPPALYEVLSPSPDGNYFLSVRTVRPYPYLLAEDFRFPKEIEVLDIRGQRVATLAKRGNGGWGNLDRGWAVPGPRRFAWAPGTAATLVYIEALDGGDPRVKAPYRDRLMRLQPPFAGPGVEMIRTRGRMSGAPEYTRFIESNHNANIAWLQDGSAWVEEVDLETRRKRAWQVQIVGTPAPAKLLLEMASESRLADSGGVPMLIGGFVSGTTSGFVTPVVRQDGKNVYLVGAESSERGGRPFLKRFNIETQKTTLLFQSDTDAYEEVLAVLDPAKVLTRRETATEAPNYYVRRLGEGIQFALTDPAAGTKQLASLVPRLIQYSRSDGLRLSGHLYLPDGADPHEPLPTLIWAYPRTYTNRGLAETVRHSANRYAWDANPRYELGIRLLVTQGYAVLWNAGMPIVDEKGEQDSAVEQMVSNAQAAVDELIRLKVSDRTRIAIGGQSFGGAMTGMLLANSSLFAAGIAIDGGFNFSNAPLGFQYEDRTLWQAQSSYFTQSSLFGADRIHAPLLLVHGELDKVPATHPTESLRMYHALDGLGRKARMVMLPYEGHVPEARESVNHVVWEVLGWLDRYLKEEPRMRPTASNPQARNVEPPSRSARRRSGAPRPCGPKTSTAYRAKRDTWVPVRMRRQHA
jgi:dipeptidyl aminopeptidase/acylaminoacyl peptidase